MPPAAAAPAAMNWIEAISIVSGLASLILAILAIWLALYFYTKTKDSEGRVAVGLEAIKTQTDALQKLTGRWMDRLTRYATEAKPADESFVVLVQALREMPGTVINLLRPPVAGATPEALINEVVSGYIGIYYYTAVTNLMSQGYLPADREQAEARVVEMVDQSHRDYQFLEHLLGGVDQRLVQNNAFNRPVSDRCGLAALDHGRGIRLPKSTGATNMIQADLRTKIRELIESGALPSDPPVIQRSGRASRQRRAGRTTTYFIP